MKTNPRRLWTSDEHSLFLEGCVNHGWGRWKDIAASIPTRNMIQVKSHAQKFAAAHPGQKRAIEMEHAWKELASGGNPSNDEAVSDSDKGGQQELQDQMGQPKPPVRGAYLRRVSNDLCSRPDPPPTPVIIPTKFDVICALGEAYSMNHVGNWRFQWIIVINLHKFTSATSVYEKKLMIEEVLTMIKCSGGRFVQRRDSGEWKVGSDAFARKKIEMSFISYVEVSNFAKMSFV